MEATAYSYEIASTGQIELTKEQTFEMYKTMKLYFENDSKLKSGIFDMNGIELEAGQNVSVHKFVYNAGNTHDWFGVEIQNSRHIVEAYVEIQTYKVIWNFGAFCFEISNEEKIPIATYIENQLNNVYTFKDIEGEDEYKYFLEEGIGDRPYKESELKKLFSEFIVQ